MCVVRLEGGLITKHKNTLREETQWYITLREYMPGGGLWQMKKYRTAWHSLLLAFQSTLLCWESAVEGPEVVEMVKLVAHDARPARGHLAAGSPSRCRETGRRLGSGRRQRPRTPASSRQRTVQWERGVQ